MVENINIEKKSLRFLNGRSTDWRELAKDCVCFANSKGGFIYIGIEDNENLPPESQRIDDTDIIGVIQKKVAELTINVSIIVAIKTAENNSEFIEVIVNRNQQTIASTSDGRYYIRIYDQCKPIPPDELSRLASDKNAFVWEEQTSRKVPSSKFDKDQKEKFLQHIRGSDRVSDFISQKSDDEILDYYFFQKNGLLTNLGILWIGERQDRAFLLYAPVIQIIRYNENESKIWKLQLDDYSLNPQELLYKVINEVPDWKESIEISDGMFRKNVHFFPLEVIRELVVNALVHRTYTTRGDIFINIFTDRVEIHSPGRLPYGVTPSNILSQSVRRNEHLSKVFYDLGLMEKEGSGYDLVYARLLGSGKPLPVVEDQDERVKVTVKKQFISTEIVQLMDKATKEYNLNQKEVIALGLLAQQQSYSSMELSKILNQNEESGLNNWLNRLIDVRLALKSGKGKGTQYSVNPEFIRRIKFKGKTNLKNIEEHRLEELIFKDLKSYPNSSFGEIHQRIGKEINTHTVRRKLKAMVSKGILNAIGLNKGVKYSLK